MTWVAMKLRGVRTKRLAKKVNISQYRAQQPVVAIEVTVCERCLNQVPGIVSSSLASVRTTWRGDLQLMHVSQVGKALSWRYNRVVDIQVAIGLLGRPDHLDQFLHGMVDLW